MPVADQGQLLNRYKIVHRTLIFLFQGGKILLLKGNPDKKLWANLYNGVGGHIERGESVINAARRELFEETSLRINDLWLCGTIMIDVSEQIGIGIYIFKGELDGELDNEGIQVKLDFQSKDGVLKWIPIDELWDLPLVEDLPILLPKIIDCQPEMPPFHALYSYDKDGKLTVSFND